MATSLEELQAPGFPLERGPKGYFRMSVGQQVINESLAQLLGTPIGARVMLPTYGCGIHSLVFEPNDDVLVTLGCSEVRKAIESWERRVALDGAGVTGEVLIDANAVRFTVRYRIVSTGQIGSMTYDLVVNR